MTQPGIRELPESSKLRLAELGNSNESQMQCGMGKRVRGLLAHFLLWDALRGKKRFGTGRPFLFFPYRR